MNIVIRSNKIVITEAMKEYATEKLSKLDKYIDKQEEVTAHVNVRIPKFLHKVEITIPLKSFILRAEEEQEDYYAAIDVAIDKLERQIRKNKTRLASKKIKEARDFTYDYMDSILVEELEGDIVKRKTIKVEPMTEEEAITRMDLLGHQFFMFRDVETEDIAVAYRRKDGDYGIIEAE